MPLMDARNAQLVLIDIQERLMPAIDRSERVVAHALKLVEVARLLGVPIVATEQSPGKLGRTLAGIGDVGRALPKTSFDACAEPTFLEAVLGDRELVVAGCEAHVCVLQTVLTLLAHRRRVVVVQDAVGSRAAESREAALSRMAAHGAEIVTTEMVLFEWLRTADHPRFKAMSTLIR